MRKGKIVKLSTVWYDEGNNIQGGRDFYLPENSRIILIQEWEHTASRKIWGPMTPDPIGEDGLLEYWLTCWQVDHENDRVYHVQDVDGDYR